MKRKTAKEILAESFRELAQKKAADKITVKEIADNCGYSVATFYRQFNDKYDLVAWDYARDIDDILKGIDGNYPSWQQALLTASEYYIKNREYLANLLKHTSGYDSFVRYMTEIDNNIFRETVLNASALKELDESTKIYIRIYILGTVNITCEWILGQFEATPEEMAEIYENALPLPLKQYLY